ncbi:MAG: hypothetical protein ACK40G_12290 [Cytophagaceae bacterium]
MKKIILLLLFSTVFNLSQIFAQDNKLPIQVSFFNNGTSLPTKPFSRPIHPGIQVGTWKVLKERSKSSFIQNFKLGYFFHRYNQHGIQLFTETAYRFKIYKGLGGETMLGLGYLHSIPDMQIFVLKDGEYVKKRNWGRPQIMFGLAGGLFYQFEKDFPAAIFLNLHFWMQAPYVKSYVPMLPNTSLHLGLRFNINKN